MNEETKKDINELTNEIDRKLEELKADPSYNEEEGRKQIDEIYAYMKNHPTSPEDVLKKLNEKLSEFDNK